MFGSDAETDLTAVSTRALLVDSVVGAVEMRVPGAGRGLAGADHDPETVLAVANDLHAGGGGPAAMPARLDEQDALQVAAEVVLARAVRADSSASRLVDRLSPFGATPAERLLAPDGPPDALPRRAARLLDPTESVAEAVETVVPGGADAPLADALVAARRDVGSARGPAVAPPAPDGPPGPGGSTLPPADSPAVAAHALTRACYVVGPPGASVATGRRQADRFEAAVRDGAAPLTAADELADRGTVGSAVAAVVSGVEGRFEPVAESNANANANGNGR